MNHRLGAVAVLDAGFLGVWAMWSSVRARPMSPVQLTGLALLQLLLMVQAVVDVVRIAGGHHPPETFTHLGYLIVSVAVLPVSTAPGVRRSLSGTEAQALVRGDAALVAFGCAVAVVIVLRLFATGVSFGG